MSSSTVTSSSSPPLTPSSPLPVSVGPGRRRYAFTPSPSASPPFSPAATSPSPSLPLLERAVQSEPRLHYAAFSTDAAFANREQRPRRRFDLGAWCFEWVLVLVCCCCRRSSRPGVQASELNRIDVLTALLQARAERKIWASSSAEQGPPG